MSNKARSVSKTLRVQGGLITLRPVATGGGGYNPAIGASNPKGLDGQFDEIRAGMLMDQIGTVPRRGFGHSNEPMTMIDGATKWLLMDAIGVDPKMGDKIIVGMTMYEVLNVQTTTVQNAAVLHTLALKA